MWQGRILLLQSFSHRLWTGKLAHKVSLCNSWKLVQQRYADCTASSLVTGWFVQAASLWRPLVPSFFLAICCPAPKPWILHFVAALFCHKPWAFQGIASYLICAWHSMKFWAWPHLAFSMTTLMTSATPKLRCGCFQWQRGRRSLHTQPA